MKKLIIISCILLIAGFSGISYAQDAVKEVPVLTADQQQAVDEVISMNPRLSAKEIEQLKIAVLGAPAKVELAIDPKEESQPEVMAAPVNAEPIPLEEIREPATLKEPVPMQQISSSPIQVDQQPEGQKAETVINYRTIAGPQTQPEPKKSGTVLNYRSINGPDTQPEGKTPGKL